MSQTSIDCYISKTDCCIIQWYGLISALKPHILRQMVIFSYYYCGFSIITKEFGLTVALSVSCKLAVAKRLCVIKSYSDILTRYANYSLAVFLFVDRKVNFWLLWYWSSIEEYSYISSASHNNVLYHSHCAPNYAKRQMREP